MNKITWKVQGSGGEALDIVETEDTIVFTRKPELKKLLTNGLWVLKDVTEGQHNRNTIHKQLDDWLDLSLKENA
jgi:hypothetical protein